MKKNNNELLTSINESIFERTASDEIINQIIEFINKNFNTTDSPLSQMENCRKLSSYLTRNNITLGDIESDKLLDESKELMDMFDRLQKSGTISKAYKSQDLITLLDIYSQKTNVQVQDDYENLFFEKINDKDLDLFKLYLNEIGQYKLLTREEEKELAIKSRNGDTEARNKLVEHNLKLVISVAKRYVTNEMSLNELILAGNEGLIIAARRFDPTLGYKFSTYAIWWIRQSIQKAIIESGRTIRVPAHIQDYIIKFKKEISIYYKETGEYPSNEYFEEKFALTPEKVVTIKLAMEPIISLSTPIGSEESGITLADMIEGETDTFDESLNNIDAEKLATELINSDRLTEREREVLKHRMGFYGNPKTLEEVGQIYNLSRERIRQIEAKALKKLLKVYQYNRSRNYVRKYKKEKTLSLK